MLLENYKDTTEPSPCVISPIALTDAQRSSLVTEFQVSWDAHIADGCDFNCGSMVWPTT